MDNQEQYFKLPHENGEEQLCRVVFTFDSAEHDKSYVLFSLVDENGNETVGDISALTFDLDENEEMVNFQSIVSEEEWAMVNEVLMTLIDEYEEEPKFMSIVNENGEEQVCEIIHTFESAGKSYVLYVFANDQPIDERDIFASCYKEGENGEIEELISIETDEEWEMVEDVLNEL